MKIRSDRRKIRFYYARTRIWSSTPFNWWSMRLQGVRWDLRSNFYFHAVKPFLPLTKSYSSFAYSYFAAISLNIICAIHKLHVHKYNVCQSLLNWIQLVSIRKVSQDDCCANRGWICDLITLTKYSNNDTNGNVWI